MLTLIVDTDQQILRNLKGTYIFYVITYRCSEKTFPDIGNIVPKPVEGCI
jgi:hypothetical protein